MVEDDIFCTFLDVVHGVAPLMVREFGGTVDPHNCGCIA